MFSKPKISDTPSSTDKTKTATSTSYSASSESSSAAAAPSYPSKPKPSPSLLSSDLTIKGNVLTSGDIQIEGTIEGDVRAHLLTVGEGATIKGEITADDVVVNGRVVGRLRGLKVRLTTSAQVEGDIVHKTIAIESGAHFEGSVQRSEDPLGDAGGRGATRPAPKTETRDAPPLTGQSSQSSQSKTDEAKAS